MSRFIALQIVMLLAAGCAQSHSQDRQASVEGSQTSPRAELVSLLGRPLYAMPVSPQREKLEADLAAGRADLAEHPADPDKIIWAARRLGYLWRMNEAIAVLSDGIIAHPDYAPLYRHRGHRYISIRRFDEAVADLQRAAQLIAGRPDVIEPDGMPNARNIPLTTLGFNIWYHLGVARYCQGDFEGAVHAFRQTAKFARGYDDNIVAVADWTWMTLRRLGREAEAAESLDAIRPDMDIIENHAYHRRCLMYKGVLAPDELLNIEKITPLDRATLGYGLGNWYLCYGQLQKAVEAFEEVVSGDNWPAFGFIAAEVDLTRVPRH
jgi:tetratricopeptide (TPR) repeat protein